MSLKAINLFYVAEYKGANISWLLGTSKQVKIACQHLEFLLYQTNSRCTVDILEF